MITYLNGFNTNLNCLDDTEFKENVHCFADLHNTIKYHLISKFKRPTVQDIKTAYNGKL